ncbi:MAG: PQQ-like beta-propeller repeat protein [Spirochaetaceae bacterium]|jgi:outer membrane protein assembly factor BamB|nr:PQQ-like beta-propeller repeat protein [Spirochaetaceae bacterium]GMO24357.1 MAG: hypothetical protein Pg6A_11460 [Termitinemataceae bacterium]
MSKLIFTLLFAVAFNAAADPVLRWREPLNGAIISGISAQLGSVVAVAEGGSILAFGEDGKPFWNYQIRGRFLPYFTRSRMSASYVCRSNGDFIALNRSGLVQWRLSLGEPLAAQPLCGWDERLFIVLKNKILCFTASGQRLWTRAIEAPPDSDPQLDGEGGFLMLLENNSILILSPFGEQKIIKLSEKPALLTPVTLNGGERILAVYGDGRMELYQKNGRQQGKLLHLGKAPLAAASHRSNVAVQLVSGELALLDVESAQILWRAASRPGVGAAGNRSQKINIRFDAEAKLVYVLSITGVAAFSLVNGEEMWTLRLENAAVSPAIDEGYVFCGGRDWIFYAYDAEGRPRKQEVRPNLPAPGNYGLGRAPGFREWSAIKDTFNEDFEMFLEDSAKAIKSGNIGADEPAVIRILLGVLGDAKLIQTERIKAAKLLGIAGSVEIIPYLARRLTLDTEISVKAEIALALGRIGADPQGRVMSGFSRLIELNRDGQNESLLSALASAIGSISKFSGPPVSEHAVKLLVELSEIKRSPAVQHEARRELDRLSKH